MGIIHLVRTQNVPKNSFLPPDIHKRVRISGGGVGWEGGGGGTKCSFFGNFTYLLNE